MKKLIVGITLGLFAIAPMASAAALTQQQIDAVLNLLRAFGADAGVIANVESSLTGKGSPPASAAWCHTFNTNLKIGDQNEEVTNLDRALVKEGFLNSDEVFQDGRTALNFDEMTAAAVVGFQEKYRSEILTPNGLAYGTGYVGAATRKKLNQLYGCASTVVDDSVSIKLKDEMLNVGERTTVNVKFAGSPLNAHLRLLDPADTARMSDRASIVYPTNGEPSSFWELKGEKSGLVLIKACHAYIPHLCVTTKLTIREGGKGESCPADAKQCPDGSYVSRTGPNCEFAACPMTEEQTGHVKSTYEQSGKRYLTIDYVQECLSIGSNSDATLKALVDDKKCNLGVTLDILKTAWANNQSIGAYCPAYPLYLGSCYWRNTNTQLRTFDITSAKIIIPAGIYGGSSREMTYDEFKSEVALTANNNLKVYKIKLKNGVVTTITSMPTYFE